MYEQMSSKEALIKLLRQNLVEGSFFEYNTLKISAASLSLLSILCNNLNACHIIYQFNNMKDYPTMRN